MVGGWRALEGSGVAVRQKSPENETLWKIDDFQVALSGLKSLEVGYFLRQIPITKKEIAKSGS
ncbi:hypothetical protein J6590_047192 [Homalodisca vitripennis]|nr:hypothetical protein J6590_047192 [Homalodisca vitripennis]